MSTSELDPLTTETNDVHMPPETLEALRGSIKKWTKIVDGTGHDAGIGNCPLCQLFHSKCRQDRQPGCSGCPVQQSTGRSTCLGSPYEAYEAAMDIEDAEGMRDNAIEELAFLKTLLPPGDES